MFKQNKPVGKLLLATAVFALSLTACKRDRLTANNECIECSNPALSTNALEANGNSPAAHIAASESVEIPAAVALPENFPGGNSRVATYYAVGV